MVFIVQLEVNRILISYSLPPQGSAVPLLLEKVLTSGSNNYCAISKQANGERRCQLDGCLWCWG